MKENTLLKIALICSLAGLLALYFISQKIELKEYKPNALNKNIGDYVSLKGTVAKITEKGNVVFIEIEQQIPVTIVLFTDNSIDLKDGEAIEVIGKVQEYNGKNEIIADKVRVVK